MNKTVRNLMISGGLLATGAVAAIFGGNAVKTPDSYTLANVSSYQMTDSSIIDGVTGKADPKTENYQTYVVNFKDKSGKQGSIYVQIAVPSSPNDEPTWARSRMSAVFNKRFGQTKRLSTDGDCSLDSLVAISGDGTAVTGNSGLTAKVKADFAPILAKAGIQADCTYSRTY